MMILQFNGFIYQDQFNYINNLQYSNFMQTNNPPVLDYFKLFKLLTLKSLTLEKSGNVKLVQDKTLNRKVLAVQGNVSASNYIIFKSSDHPNIVFNNKFLYIQGLCQPGKHFTFLLKIQLNSKIHRILLSTLYKDKQSKQVGNVLQYPLKMQTNKWSLIIIDLFELVSSYSQKQDIRISFKLSTIEIRASSLVKGIFLSDTLFSVDKLPKQMQFPKRTSQKEEEFFFTHYGLVMIGNQPMQLYTKQQQKQQKSTHNGQEKSQKIKKEEKIMQKSIYQAKNPQNKNSQIISNTKEQIESKVSQRQSTVTNAKISSRSTINLKNKRQSEPIRKRQPSTQSCKNIGGNLKYHEEIGLIQQEEPIEHPLQQPKPKATLSLNLLAIQGMTLSKNSIVTVGSFVVSPFMMQTHKAISCLSYEKKRPVDLLLGYRDGCIALWDSIKKKPIKYYKTQLVSIKKLLLDMSKTIIVVGQDQLKRDTIIIMKDDAIIFQQLSNYNINGIKLLNNQSFKQGLISYGLQNIRLWKIKESNNIIVGSNIYLGKLCRNNVYTDCALIGDMAYLVDQHGFLTKISIKSEQMSSSKKISQQPLDHIMFTPRNQQFITINSHGTIKIHNLTMETLCEFPLQQRVIDVYFQSNRENTLQLVHYNKSAGTLDLDTGSYKFGTRCHTSSILGLKYHRPTGNIISISKDQTIRLWSINMPHSQIREQYEFRITNHSVSCVQVSHRNSWSLVGFDDGLVRKICLEQCKILGQTQLIQQGKTIDQISISKDDKYVLISSKKQSKLLDSDLMEINTYPAKKITSKRHIKFNTENKSFFIQNDQQSLEFFELKNPSQPYCVLYLESPPQMISFNNNFVHVYSNNNYYLYKFQKQELSFSLNNIISHYKSHLKQTIVLQFPLLCGCNQNQLLLTLCDLSSLQSISTPQPLQRIQICTKESIIIGAGRQSNSLYLFKYQSRNLPTVQDICQENIKELQQSHAANQFTQKIPIFMGNNWQLPSKYKNEDVPQRIKSLYQEQEKIFQQCKHHIIPDIQEQQNQQSIVQNTFEQVPQYRIGFNQQSEACLLYGADIQQPSNKLLWDFSNRILFFTCKHNLICHYFTQPISQKIIELSISPSKLQLSNSKYLGISMSSTIRLYNRIQNQISFSKTIEVNSVHAVNDWTFTPCENYIIALGTNVNHIGKLIITVLEIATSNVVACSYLELTPPTGSSTSKRVQLFNQLIKSFRIEINSSNNKPGIQFIIFSKTLVYFYRVTSMLTLQMQQLQLSKIKDYVGNWTTLSYVILEQKQQVILLGSDNGSILIVDSRSGNIVVLCKSVVKCSLSKISYYDNKLVLLSNNQNILLFDEIYNVENIIAAVDKAPRILTIDSIISSYSDINNNGQLLILGSLGSVWLIDIMDSLTIKILSFHSKPITVVKSYVNGNILTGSQDGFVRETSLTNLEQQRQIFKPRKAVRDFHYSKQKQILCVGFDNELYFYHWQNQNKQNNKCYGSITFKDYILRITQIPKTLNYLIQTYKQIIMICISNLSQQNTNNKFQIEMQPLTESTSSFLRLQINPFLPYDVFMTCSQDSKINVWMRKCLKRGHNPLIQLQKVHDLQYYLIDTHSSKYSRQNCNPYCYFTGKQQYICAFPQQHSIQIRNFNQHILIREITTDTTFSIMKIIETQHKQAIMIGDYDGYISILNMQGANIKKLQTGRSKIKDIEQLYDSLYGVLTQQSLKIMNIQLI